MLYWFSNNLVSMTQQKVTNRILKDKDASAEQSEKADKPGKSDKNVKSVKTGKKGKGKKGGKGPAA